jgi:APA family basic amino acid/polyamine antiporter
MAALLIVVIAVYNVLGGWSHRRVRGIVTWLVAALLLLLCLVCLPRVRLTDYGPFSPHGYLGVQAGLSLLFIGFLAFESLPLTMSEIPEPRRTIPRAFLATAGLGILLSMAVTLVAGSSLTGVGLLEVRLPVAALAEECAGGYGPLVLLLAVIFIPMALNSALLLVVRQAQEMEQDGLLPDFLRRRTVRFQTPHILLALIGALAALLSLWGDLEQIARLGGFCILFAMRMRGTEEEEPSGFRLPVPPLIPALALVVNVFLLPIVGTGPLLAGAVWLGAGLVVYVVYARGRYIAGQEGVVVFRLRESPWSRSTGSWCLWALARGSRS